MQSSSFFQIFLFGLLWVAPAYAQVESHEGFSGGWELDNDNSDSLHQLLSGEVERFNQVTGLRTRQGKRNVVVMGSEIRKFREEKVAVLCRYLDSIVPFEPLINIRYEAPLLRLIYKSGKYRDIFTDERDSSTIVQSATAQQDQKLVFASFDKETGKIIIETNSNSGTTITETLSVVGGSKSEKQKLKYEFKIQSVRLISSQELTYIYQRSVKF